MALPRENRKRACDQGQDRARWTVMRVLIIRSGNANTMWYSILKYRRKALTTWLSAAAARTCSMSPPAERLAATLSSPLTPTRLQGRGWRSNRNSASGRLFLFRVAPLTDQPARGAGFPVEGGFDAVALHHGPYFLARITNAMSLEKQANLLFQPVNRPTQRSPLNF